MFPGGDGARAGSNGKNGKNGTGTILLTRPAPAAVQHPEAEARQAPVPPPAPPVAAPIPPPAAPPTPVPVAAPRVELPVARPRQSHGCLGLLGLGLAALAGASILTWTASERSDITVKNAAFGQETHRQDVFLEPGEELTYCATGTVKVGEILARKINSSKQIEVEHARGERQGVLAEIEKVRPFPATSEALSTCLNDMRRGEDALTQGQIARAALKDRVTQRLETLEDQLQTVARELVSADGKCASAEIEVEQRKGEYERAKDLVDQGVLEAARKIDATNSLHASEQNLALARAERTSLQQSKAYFQEKVDKARAELSDSLAHDDAALEAITTRLHGLRGDQTRLEEQATGEIVQEKNRLQKLADSQATTLDELVHQAETTIVSHVSGRVMQAPVRMLERPVVIAFDDVSVSGEVHGGSSQAGELLRSGAIRLILKTGEREDPCTVSSFSPGADGQSRITLQPAQVEWSTLSDPAGKQLSVRTEYGPLARWALDPVFWTGSLLLGIGGMLLVAVSGFIYKRAATPADPHAKPRFEVAPVRTPPAKAPAAPQPAPPPAPEPARQVLPANAPAVAEIEPNSSGQGRGLVQVKLKGKNLEQCATVHLKETPCRILPQRDATTLTVEVPVYFVEEGLWHFVLGTASGTVKCPQPFTVFPPPPPRVTGVPKDVPHSGNGATTFEIEGRHFARLKRVFLTGAGGEVPCPLAKEPEPEPNDNRLLVALAADVKPGAYRLVVETRSGTSQEAPTLNVLPNAIDRVDSLLEQTLAGMILTSAEPELKERVQALLREEGELDAATRAAMKKTPVDATFSPDELGKLHEALERSLSDEAARKHAALLRQQCPEWIADLAESAFLSFVSEMEPRRRNPTEDEIAGYARSGASASRMLHLGEALFFQEARGTRLRGSLEAALAVYRERQLPHVFSKVKDQLVALKVGAAPAAPDDGFA